MRSSGDDFDKLENRLRDSTFNKGSTMCATLALPEGWRSVATPPSLFRRFQFAGYGETRAFLERLSALSEETGIYPDLGFGTTHVNVTLYGKDGQAPGTAEVDFASRATLAFTG